MGSANPDPTVTVAPSAMSTPDVIFSELLVRSRSLLNCSVPPEMVGIGYAGQIAKIRLASQRVMAAPVIDVVQPVRSVSAATVTVSMRLVHAQG